MNSISRVLMVANCTRRGNGPAAYIGDLLSYIKKYAGNSICVDLLVTQLNSGYVKSDFDVENLFLPEQKPFQKAILRIPRIRAYYWEHILLNTFERILESNKYDIVVFHAIPRIISNYVKIANNNNVKVLLYPWGSEVLRASAASLNRFRFAFENADYVRGDRKTLYAKLNNEYKIPDSKYVNLCYGSKVVSLINDLRGKYSKEELADVVGLNKASFYIVCGYNAYSGQQHEAIINEMALVKDCLPKDYELVFPLSYGEGMNTENLKRICETYGLRYEFITEYLSDEQMACLHLLSDVFIHVQKTDLANSFIEESIYAGTTIINGGWLSYDELEKVRKPYYTAPTISELHSTILEVINDKENKYPASKQVIDSIYNESWECVIPKWVEFFKRH